MRMMLMRRTNQKSEDVPKGMRAVVKKRRVMTAMRRNATEEGENLNNIWEKFELKLNDWVTTTLPTIVSEVIKSIAGEAVKKHIDEYVSSTEFKKSLGESIDFDSQQLRDEIKSINTELKTGLMELKNEVNMLKNENDNLEQYTRRCNIRIYGIPEAPTESTDDIVISFLQKELGVTISEVDISRSHRVGKKTNIARPIIIRFTKQSYDIEETTLTKTEWSVSIQDSRRPYTDKKTTFEIFT
ncbi:Hypothetical predicted protein [Paramuricea clavata]|uniref:Uncharacterized protein n=1 Tax=Paramuricea clavata TaxID=317549 RepID=A0A6S7K4N8_PARCT|nr:Hypothetical predicted protein [Paramuricea clavata]